MNLINRHTINLFHDYRVQNFGAGSVESLGWPSLQDQLARFEILSSIADLNDRVVVDAGCGHGDLYPHLQKKYPAVNYIGIEQNTSFLDIALQRYGNAPQAKFLLGDFTNAALPPADYVLCSGGLSYQNNDKHFIPHSIEKLFNSCRYGLGFNLLSSVKNPEGILVAYDPEAILNICRKLTTNLRVYNDYLPKDFSVFLYH